MRVAVLHVEIHIPYAQSLKDKRMVLRRIKDRLQKFNVAVAELENQDLWQRLSEAVSTHQVRWKWVKGHNGHIENERVDVAAREQAELMKAGI